MEAVRDELEILGVRLVPERLGGVERGLLLQQSYFIRQLNPGVRPVDFHPFVARHTHTAGVNRTDEFDKG